MRIGILGGTFDPPHFGHLALAKAAKEHFQLDEIWFVPVFISPFKTDTKPASPEHRLEMVKLLIADHPDYKALDLEILKKRPSYTIDSLEYLKNKFPTYQFYLIMGQDALDHFLAWRDPKRIVELVHLAVAPRSPQIDLSFLKDHPEVYSAAQKALLPMPLNPISSTEIREKAKQNKSLKKFLPKEIEDYIAKHHLYDDEN
jgi:nicotinate-nucleotide adenylyltransferase